MLIELGIGINQIHFGIDEKTLRQSLGNPDKIDRDADENPLLIYNNHRCTYWMDEDDRLHWIQTENPNAILLGQPIIGRSAQVVFDELSEAGIGPFELEDYGSMESHSAQDSELEIQVEYGAVSRVGFGHLWSENDEPIYPSAVDVSLTEI